LAFVQYSFDRKEHKIDIQPHGKSKKEAAFQRTKPSTVKLIKASVAENRRPLKEVENLQGMMQAKLSCDLRRDRRQFYNFKSANKVKLEKQWPVEFLVDTLAHVMSQCKELSYVLLRLLQTPCVCSQQTSNLVRAVAAFALERMSLSGT
jgi:superfamily II helicase